MSQIYIVQGNWLFRFFTCDLYVVNFGLSYDEWIYIVGFIDMNLTLVFLNDYIYSRNIDNNDHIIVPLIQASIPYKWNVTRLLGMNMNLLMLFVSKREIF